MNTEPQMEHKWLQQLLGDWTSESEMEASLGQPSEKYRGTETVRALGELWVVCEGRGEMPGGAWRTC